MAFLILQFSEVFVCFTFAQERTANKIDQAEGTIMAELEGMESKRLESALECAGKLEDR